MSSPERELAQERHRKWKAEHLAELRASGVPFEERPEACLFRVPGKPLVDFYPSTGRWRVVAGQRRTYRGGAAAFLAWYAKQGTTPSAPEQAVAVLLAAGFVEDGTTREETVRVPTRRSPVFGGIGGELRTFGGRARYTLPGTDVRATVGPRTVNVYRRGKGRDAVFLPNGNIRTGDFTRDALRLALAAAGVQLQESGGDHGG